jgi:phosphoglycolate phosphatase
MLKPAKLDAKGIMFDLDGTILDVRSAYLEAAKKAFSSMGQRTVNIVLVTEIPKRLEQDQPIDNLLEGIDVREFLRIYLRSYYQSTTDKAKLIPRVSETLTLLCRKAKLALITRRGVSQEEVKKELEKFGLDNFFQYITTALDTEKPKPSPEALIRCSREMRVSPSDCIIVGDSVVDVRAGKNASIRTVAVLSGIFSREELEKENPDLILENVNQLPNHIK